LGLALVAGKKRVPKPATGKMAFLMCCMGVLGRFNARQYSERQGFWRVGEPAFLPAL
jgi:hypothetical protein